MGHSPLATQDRLHEICEYLENKGDKTLYDISKWNESGLWIDWEFRDIPTHLLQQSEMLKQELREAAPVHKSEKDKWGWGPTRAYTSAKGYEDRKSVV